ncbi:MAG: hypothetical protein KAI50_08705, partial [Desulfobacterales bacterium]|nr:hypothetical protein [Desulfobacterales bacterium]
MFFHEAIIRTTFFTVMRIDRIFYTFWQICQKGLRLKLRTMRPNLSKSMQWLGTRYTRRFNLRNLQ